MGRPRWVAGVGVFVGGEVDMVAVGKGVKGRRRGFRGEDEGLGIGGRLRGLWVEVFGEGGV